MVGIFDEIALFVQQAEIHSPAIHADAGNIGGSVFDCLCDAAFNFAQELGKINEATETFKVLSSMATGLVLAFNTTLVALLTYLPLRKAADYLGQRLGALEEHWTRWRNGQEDRR